MNKASSFISKLSKRERALFYLTAFVVLVAFVFRFLLVPVISKIKSVDKEIEGKKKATENSLLILARKDKIEEEGKKYKPYLEKIFSQKTAEEGTSSLEEKVDTLAEEAGIKLLETRSLGQEEETPFRKETLGVECEGELDKILDFFSLVENSPPQLLRVEKFYLTPKGPRAPVAKCSVEISGVIETIPPPEK